MFLIIIISAREQPEASRATSGQSPASSSRFAVPLSIPFQPCSPLTICTRQLPRCVPMLQLAAFTANKWHRTTPGSLPKVRPAPEFRGRVISLPSMSRHRRAHQQGEAPPLRSPPVCLPLRSVHALPSAAINLHRLAVISSKGAHGSSPPPPNNALPRVGGAVPQAQQNRGTRINAPYACRHASLVESIA